MKRKTQLILTLYILIINVASAKEYHVAKSGNDSNDGSLSKPFKSISKAVEHAFSGDTITVHEGVYREWINPLRGGNSDNERIVYRAAEGEMVEIKGSELVTVWKRDKNNVWKVVLSNTFFNDYHSLKDSINGDWFINEGRIHHTGELFLNGISLYEKEKLEMVFDAYKPTSEKRSANGYTWFCESNDNTTTIWANFHDVNPNEELIELSIRPTCFYPSKPNHN